MASTIIHILFIVTAIYLSAGLLFAIVFLTHGVTKVDKSASGSGIGFRIIIIPGIMVFWPLLLKKWIQAENL